MTNPFANVFGSPLSCPTCGMSLGLGGHCQYCEAKNASLKQYANYVNSLMGGLGSGLGVGLQNQIAELPAKPKLDRSAIDKLKSVDARKVSKPMPDFFEPLVSWRAWKVGFENGELRLQALGMTGVWPAKKPMEATCLHSYKPGIHSAPHKSCECGVWSFTTMDKLLEAVDGSYEVKVFGEIHMWGRVIECSNGFRSQFAYPKELWLLDGSLEQLGYIYGVPVRTL